MRAERFRSTRTCFGTNRQPSAGRRPLTQYTLVDGLLNLLSMSSSQQQHCLHGDTPSVLKKKTNPEFLCPTFDRPSYSVKCWTRKSRVCLFFRGQSEYLASDGCTPHALIILSNSDYWIGKHQRRRLQVSEACALVGAVPCRVRRLLARRPDFRIDRFNFRTFDGDSSRLLDKKIAFCRTHRSRSSST